MSGDLTLMSNHEFNLEQKVSEIVKNFLYSLESLKLKIKDERQEVDKQLKIISRNEGILKEQQRDGLLATEAKQRGLAEEIVRYKGLQSEIQKEIAKYQSSQKEVQQLKQDAIEAVKSVKGEESLAQEARLKLDGSIKNYKDKTISLRDDFTLLEERTKKANGRDRASRIRDMELLNREQKISESERKLAIREIEVRDKEQQIKLEMKRVAVNG